MVSRNTIASLDIGTSAVKIAVGEKKRGEQELRCLAVGLSASNGVRKGAVVDADQAAHSIREALRAAQKSAGVSISPVWAAVGGSHISVSSSRGVVAVSRADGEISPEDVKRSLAAAETFIPKNPNKEILHIIPRDFKVDNEIGIKDPVGMHGVRLEVDALIIECSGSFLKNMLKASESAGLKVIDYVFSPLAASEAVLNKRQKELGVVLLDIGAATSSFIVFEEGIPIHAGVISIGGAHITNDVAIGFQVQVDVAEKIKIAHGSCLPEEVAKKEMISLSDFVENQTAVFPKRRLAEIMEARMEDIFELLQKELKRIGRTQLLPAGAVLVGGSSRIPGVVELAKRELRLPAELGLVKGLETLKGGVVLSLAVGWGVLEWADLRTDSPSSFLQWGGSRLKNGKFLKWLKSLLP